MALRAQMEASRPGSKHQLCHPLAVRPQVRQDNYSSHLKGLLDDEMLDAGMKGMCLLLLFTPSRGLHIIMPTLHPRKLRPGKIDSVKG